MFYQVKAWCVKDGKVSLSNHSFNTRGIAKAMFEIYALGYSTATVTWAQMAAMVDEKNGFLIADYTPRRGVAWVGGGNSENM